MNNPDRPPKPDHRVRSTEYRVPRFLAVAGVSLGIGGLALIHFYVRSQGASYSGPLLVADHTFDLLLALSLMSFSTAVGLRALALLELKLEQPLETLCFSTATGAGIVSVFILVLGLVGMLNAPAIALVFLAGALLARHQLRQLPSLWGRSLTYLREHSGFYGYVAAGVLALVCAILLVQAVTPPADWDSLMYHLEVPRQFLREGRVYLLEDNLHVAYTGLVQVLYIPFLLLQSPAAPAIFSALFALLLGLAAFSFAARFFDSATASLSLASLWATTGIMLVAITPRVDVTLALYLFLATYALLIALTDDRQRSHFYLAAILLGLAAGIKYHGMVYGVALAPMIVWAAYAGVRKPGATFGKLAIFAGLVLAISAPWLLKNWLLLDSPLYPFFSDRALEPWLASIYGSGVLPASVNPESLEALTQARMRFDLVDLFLAPGRLTVEPEGAYYHMNFLFLLLPLSVFFVKRRALNWLVIPAVFYVILLVLPFPATNLRYLIPAIVPLTVAAVFIAVQLGTRWLSVGASRLLLVSLTILALYPSAKTMRFWLRKSPVLGHFAGVTSARDYLVRGFGYYVRLADAVNINVPEDGKVLLLFEARGYYFEPDVIQDNRLTNWPLLAPATLTEGDCLASTGITHVLVSTLAMQYYVLRGADPAIFRWELFEPFAERCLIPSYQERNFVLFRLRSEPVEVGVNPGQP